jgi:hypothetical protein
LLAVADLLLAVLSVFLQRQHPNIMRTLAWAVVTGEGKLPARQQVWGETLDPDKPSVADLVRVVLLTQHPNIMRTLAWAVVTGEGKLPARQQVWGETLDPDKPSVDTIAAAVAANANGKSSSSTAAAAGGKGTNTVSNTRGNPYDKLMQLGTPGKPAAAAPGNAVTNGVSNSADVAAQSLVDKWEEEEGARDEDVTAGQTWMVLEYCDRGCLQVCCLGQLYCIFCLTDPKI